MDILHSGRFDGFCLVSSDSNFTRLAARIREQGINVFGFGENRTPASYRQACKRFIYTENLTSPDRAAPVVPAIQIVGDVIMATGLPAVAAATLIETALGQRDDQAGWYFLGSVGQRLIALTSDFDSRNYGSAKLITLIEKIDAFEIRRDIHSPSQSGMILGPTPWPGRVSGDLENHQFE